MSTVWAVCRAQGEEIKGLDPSYGEVEYINHRYVFADELVDVGAANNETVLPHEFQRHLERAAEEFDLERDYLLLIGDHLQIAALAAMLGRRTAKSGKTFRVLRYDRKAGGHVTVSL